MVIEEHNGMFWRNEKMSFLYLFFIPILSSFKMNKLWGSNDSIVTIVNNTALCNWKLPREYILNVLTTKVNGIGKWRSC